MVMLHKGVEFTYDKQVKVTAKLLSIIICD